jgi:general secretion pathway protein J
MTARGQSGFTLIELVVAMVILGSMMVLLYSGLAFALRSWDAGDVNGRRTADRRIGENFLRREVTEIFPMRWKDPGAVKFAFEGAEQRMRFVSSRPAGVSLGGLSLVNLEVEPGEVARSHNLVMRRVMADPDSNDFGPLDHAERSILIADVASVAFSYFGSENDFSDPRWVDAWSFQGRMPQMVRMRMKASDGTPLPEVVMKVMVGEEAGCLENTYQRQCRPRRQ